MLLVSAQARVTFLLSFLRETLSHSNLLGLFPGDIFKLLSLAQRGHPSLWSRVLGPVCLLLALAMLDFQSPCQQPLFWWQKFAYHLLKKILRWASSISAPDPAFPLPCDNAEISGENHDHSLPWQFSALAAHCKSSPNRHIKYRLPWICILAAVKKNYSFCFWTLTAGV